MMRDRHCPAVWEGIRRRQLSNVPMLVNSRSTRLMCRREDLCLRVMGQVHLVTTTGLLPTEPGAWRCGASMGRKGMESPPGLGEEGVKEDVTLE
jgi:hypothetical protein